ncbi:MAG: hypothetical protein D6677_10110 [Calditrichaeota bacterium]|nr:MAG: hypothetical protein D6677_10110 [Calditrichota bacterium]
MKNKILVIFGFLFAVQMGFAQLPNGEKTFFYTQTARTYDPGTLGIYTDMSFYSKVGDLIGGTVTPANFQAVNYWLVASNAVMTYGIMNHLDATLGVRVYQDTHYSNEFNLPDDIFLTVRAAGFKFARNRFSQGFLASFRFPTGEVHNYPFTEFAPNSFQYALMYAVSFFTDPYLPDRGFSAHFNMGWWNYNELGSVLYTYANGNELKATVNSSDFRMALAFSYPTALFDFRMELTGILFLQQPDPYVYSAEEWAFISPSIRYKPFKWVGVDLGMDFRVSPADRNNTSGIPDISARVDLPPNFPTWRVHMGINLNLNVLSSSKTEVVNYRQAKAQKQVELFETVIEEKQKAEAVQNEIENLRSIRKDAEKEIEELKKMLDDDQ